MQLIFLYLGAAMPLFWGAAHLLATKSVVDGFGEISTDNRRIITMEWVIEGVALLFIGLLVAIVTNIDPTGAVARAVYTLSIAVLLVLAMVSAMTGFRINFVPYKLCPLVFCASAALIFLGAFL